MSNRKVSMAIDDATTDINAWLTEITIMASKMISMS